MCARRANARKPRTLACAALTAATPRMPTMSGTLGSALADVLEHVEDAHGLRLLPQHVLLKVMLQCELLQDDFQPPPMVDSGPFVTRSFFLRGPVISCTRPVVPPSSSSG